LDSSLFLVSQIHHRIIKASDFHARELHTQARKIRPGEKDTPTATGSRAESSASPACVADGLHSLPFAGFQLDADFLPFIPSIPYLTSGERVERLLVTQGSFRACHLRYWITDDACVFFSVPGPDPSHQTRCSNVPYGVDRLGPMISESARQLQTPDGGADIRDTAKQGIPFDSAHLEVLSRLFSERKRASFGGVVGRKHYFSGVFQLVLNAIFRLLAIFGRHSCVDILLGPTSTFTKRGYFNPPGERGRPLRL
jgi:hypothetical protein